MVKMIPTAKKALVGAVVFGALSLGATGVAGAAAPTQAPQVPKVAGHVNCANAGKVLARIDKGEARIAAGLPRLTAAETRAAKHGHTKRAARLHKLITRLESTKFKARLTKLSSTIEARCHVPAPSATSGSTVS